MEAINGLTLTPDQNAEFDRAFELLTSFVDLSEADQLMPLGPATVYSASVVIWMLIYQRLHKNATLEVAVKQLIERAPQACRGNKRIREGTLSAKTGSYSDARQRLTLEVAEWFATHLSNSIIETAAPSLGARRAFLLDGTTITLAPEPALRALFPPASNQHGTGVWPVALLVTAHELESGCATLPGIGPMYGPKAVSEVKLAEDCLQRLPPGSIVIGDINFGIFSVAWAAAQAGQIPLLRLSPARCAALCRAGQLECQGENWKTWTVRWIPSPKDRQSNPDLPANAALDVLVHEVILNPQLTLRLVTQLTESAPTVAHLYGKRWEVEVEIRNVKVVLDTESIRARSETMFQKELYISFAAYNLVVQLRREAARLAKIPVKRLSFTGVWTTFRQFLLQHLHQEPAVWREKFEFTLRYAMRDKLPNRPGRSFPREVYPRRPKGSTFKKRKPPPDEEPPKQTK